MRAVVVAVMVAGCSKAAPTAVPPAALTDADVKLLVAAADQIEAVMADPALVSLLGVTVPFSVRMALSTISTCCAEISPFRS